MAVLEGLLSTTPHLSKLTDFTSSRLLCRLISVKVLHRLATHLGNSAEVCLCLLNIDSFEEINNSVKKLYFE